MSLRQILNGTQPGYSRIIHYARWTIAYVAYFITLNLVLFKLLTDFSFIHVTLATKWLRNEIPNSIAHSFFYITSRI